MATQQVDYSGRPIPVERTVSTEPLRRTKGGKNKGMTGVVANNRMGGMNVRSGPGTGFPVVNSAAAGGKLEFSTEPPQTDTEGRVWQQLADGSGWVCVAQGTRAFVQLTPAEQDEQLTDAGAAPAPRVLPASNIAEGIVDLPNVVAADPQTSMAPLPDEVPAPETMTSASAQDASEEYARRLVEHRNEAQTQQQWRMATYARQINELASLYPSIGYAATYGGVTFDIPSFNEMHKQYSDTFQRMMVWNGDVTNAEAMGAANGWMVTGFDSNGNIQFGQMDRETGLTHQFGMTAAQSEWLDAAFDVAETNGGFLDADFVRQNMETLLHFPNLFRWRKDAQGNPVQQMEVDERGFAVSQEFHVIVNARRMAGMTSAQERYYAALMKQETEANRTVERFDANWIPTLTRVKDKMTDSMVNTLMNDWNQHHPDRPKTLQDIWEEWDAAVLDTAEGSALKAQADERRAQIQEGMRNRIMELQQKYQLTRMEVANGYAVGRQERGIAAADARQERGISAAADRQAAAAAYRREYAAAVRTATAGLTTVERVTAENRAAYEVMAKAARNIFQDIRSYIADESKPSQLRENAPEQFKRLWANARTRNAIIAYNNNPYKPATPETLRMMKTIRDGIIDIDASLIQLLDVTEEQLTPVVTGTGRAAGASPAYGGGTEQQAASAAQRAMGY
ncbi:MAG TPA: SH3 domain-containing protein [bacterium]|nr:SH3 domain-containing protein [bacterium]